MSVNTDFADFVADEVKKYQGIAVPVKASILERIFVKSVRTVRLHPNPDDEFCSPSVGPNYEIISRYAKTIRQFMLTDPKTCIEPLIVEKIHPDGYMILNGHHRWAAAIRIGYDPVPVSIVNLTQETDIEKMIRNSKHDKRVTLDLDEVVFCKEEDTAAEKPLSFPYNRIYKERIRYGVPALLHYLTKQGYDIWVYTAQYYSMDYIRAYLKRYSVTVDAIITGTARMAKNKAETQKRTEELISNQYVETLHIDNSLVLRTRRDSKEYDEFLIDSSPEEWSSAVMAIIKRLDI